MKQHSTHLRLYALLVIIFCSFSAAQTTRSWHYQNPLPTSTLLTAIKFIDNDTGYAVGRSAILKTTDGGENWEYMIPIPFEPCNGCQSLCFPEDAQTGYVVGSGGNIVKTTDGGETWEDQFSGTSECLSDVDFPVDAQTGYVSGNSGTILKTTDGGATWQDQSLGITDYVKAIDFPVNDQTGYALDNANGYAHIWKTTDGGANWVQQGQVTSFPSTSMHFPVDANTGYVAAGNGEICKTTDGGTTWVEIFDHPYYGIDFIWFVDNQTGYAGGYLELLKTTDGGMSWTVIPLDDLHGFPCGIHFPVNGQTGYISGPYGHIFKTTDSGATWVDQRTSLLGSNDYQNMLSIHSAGNTVYAVGNDGIIIRSTDDGMTWTVLPSFGNDNDEYRSVFSINPQTTFIGGLVTTSGCAIMKTTDGGSTWTSWGLNNYPNYIQFTDSQTGYCAWNNGVLKTTNCGETWVNLSGAGTSCYGLHFPVDDQIGYTVHGGGIICKTTDGGASWAEQSTPTGVKLYSVYFTDVDTGWAVGLNATILRTTNGGATWSIQSAGGLGVGYHLESVCFSASADTGFIASANGCILATTDGGSNWVSQSIGERFFKSVCFRENSSVAYITGSAGTVMRFGDNYLGIETQEEQLINIFQPSLNITPNPFMSFTTVTGYEEEMFTLYDISGRRVGRYRGDNIGEGLCAGVYIVVPEDNSLEPVRIVKLR